MENKELAVKTESKADHEKLRVQLSKLWKKHKDTLRDIGIDDDTLMLSLCAKRDGNNGTSIFELGKSVKGKGEEKDFEIILH